MTEVASAVLEVILVAITVWVGVFGSLGAILARKRGGSMQRGLLLGALFGPFGWIVIWVETRYVPESSVGEIEDEYDIWSSQ